METGERLAAYLAGDLDTDDARSLEAELARDPSLRARLARLRVLEDHLRGLPDAEPPDGFGERLRGAVQAELDRRPVVRDELEARRQRRRTPAWLPAAAGAAAVLAVVVGIGTGLSGLMSGADQGEDATSGGDAAMDTMQAPAEESAEASMLVGPVIVADGRSYDEDSLQALAQDPLFSDIVDARLSPDEARRRELQYSQPLTGTTAEAGDGEAEAADAPDDDSATGAREVAPAPAQITGSQPVTEEDQRAIARCLDQLIEGQGPFVPVYAEIATFGEVDAIVYGILSHDPDTDAFTRVELWAVDRTDCEVVYFTQADRG